MLDSIAQNSPGSRMTRITNHERGQVGLVVLLVMVAVLTVGLAVSSRSTSQLTQVRQEAESSRSFEVAETAIEEALSLDLVDGSGGQIDVGGIEAQYQVTAQQTGTRNLGLGEVMEVNLEGATGTSFNLSWTGSGGCVDAPGQSPGVVVSVLYEGGQVVRNAYDSCGDRTDDNGFTYADGSSVNVEYNDHSNPRLARVRVVYSNAGVTVIGNNLPPQQFQVRSTATAPDGETRSIEVIQGAPERPALFDYVLYGGSGIN